MRQKLVKEIYRKSKRHVVHFIVPSNEDLLRIALDLKDFGGNERPAATSIEGSVALYLPRSQYSTQSVDPFTGDRGPVEHGGAISDCCAFWYEDIRFADIIFDSNDPAIHYYAKNVDSAHEQLGLWECCSREEGAERIVVEKTIFERDPELRKLCLREKGTSCYVCGFDSSKLFGEELRGVIEVHHIEPLSDVRKAHLVDPIRDLVPLCPNCHAAIHRMNPPLTPDELRLRMRQV